MGLNYFSQLVIGNIPSDHDNYTVREISLIEAVNPDTVSLREILERQ